MKDKKQFINQKFYGYNFSFILEGVGRYLYKGKYMTVKAPCVITQWPEEPMSYGPDNAWTEFYIIYPTKAASYLEKRGFFQADRPMWPIHNMSELIPIFNSLSYEFDNMWKDTTGDKIDLLCEELLVESMLSSMVIGPKERKVAAIMKYYNEHYLEKNTSFNALAKEHDINPVTLRRLWNKKNRLSPGKYLNHLRINKSIEYLLRTDKTIREIAHLIGIDDQNYFSHLFKEHKGVSPKDYREKFSISGIK
jgi:AraC-like DNA-binding protein